MKMPFARLNSALLALAALLFAAGPAVASSVTVVLPDAQAAAGSEIELAIEARQAQGMGPMQLDLRYDPSVLEFVGAAEGAGPAIGLFDFNLLEPGNVRLAMTGDPNQPLQGEAELFKVTFQVVGANGQESSLTADNARAWAQTEQGFDMIVEVEPGLVVVGGGLPALWLVGAAAGALILIIVLIGLMRRGKGAA